LAVVEGVTEFLPISSTGHLILVESLFTLSDDKSFNETFIIIIQLPAILSVCVYFWRTLWPIREGKIYQPTLILWTKVVAAFVPAAVLGLLLDDLIEQLLGDVWIVAVALVLGGIILIAIERRKHSGRVENIDDLTYPQAIAIGFFQCLAMIPGTSRSGASIVGGLLLGANRAVAAEFSFFLAIPTMLGATTVKMVKSGFSFTPHQWGLIALGSVVSFAVAYAVIALFMAYIRKHSFTAFGVYRIILGVIVLLALYTILDTGG